MNQQECKKLEEKISKKLTEYIKKNDVVIAGISGGPDSVFLLKMLVLSNSKILVAHVNHMLRGKQSDGDEKFVKDLAKEYNTIFSSKKSDIKKLSKKHKTGLEETGRKIRYEFFNDLAKKHKAKFIITAHHADDNLETVIMNFIRGSGIKGLSGMKELGLVSGSKNIHLLRPLLTVPKNKIADYLKSKKIQYRIDKSNSDKKFKRNFIREEIIPQLKKLNPNITESISKNIENIKEVSEFMINSARKWIKKNVLNKHFTEFNAKSFRKQSSAIQKQILIEIHKILTGTAKNLEKIHIEEVLKIINNVKVGNKKKQLGKLVVSIKSGIIKILSIK